MTDSFTDFSIELSSDMQSHGSFNNDQEDIMNTGGLSDAEKTVLRSRDPKQVIIMADNFTDFVIALSSDAQKLEAFKNDPEAVMDAAGLSGAEKTVLRTGDPELIRSAMVQTGDISAIVVLAIN
jgi:hypothetical protein